MFLSGKTAIVTGSTRGIGRAIAEALIHEGANVVICGRNSDEVKKTIDDFSKIREGVVSGTTCDVRDHLQVKSLFTLAVQTFLGVDILVNNAGVGIMRNIADLTPDEWRAVIETNLNGVYYCCHEAVPLMRQRGGGYIINISSLAGKNAIKGGTAYNASKFGLNGFSEALMGDVRHDNIKVSYIMPGSVATEFNDHKPSDSDAWKLQPEDVALAVINLLRHKDRSLPSRIELRPLKPPKG
ncbi:MAG TPA: SDR family oxidoreductase [Blastocatellia bacterium]|nr:SDR family oxidoreductase [Blastocatellia bacterium]